MPETEQPHGPRPFWSGTIAFGLISLPVSLFVANRSSGVPLRMVDDGGTPLTRRYFCEKEQRPLTADEIVRGYEVEKNEYIVVEDDELDALAPEKSQEIDLRRFVALSEIDPMYFERAYFMAPDNGAIKAYRLLAKSMEDEQRAGIATFVMRGKEYLVAIIAEKGILRAETMRFHDELRTPESIGLPAHDKPTDAHVKRFRKSLNARSRKTLDRKRLADRHSQAVLERVRKKRKAGEDVFEAPEAEDEAQTNGGEEAVDLMQVLKDSLQQKQTPDRKPKSTRQSSASKKKATPKKQKSAPAGRSKKKLYDQAQKLDVAGRSRMTKVQLIDAIEAAQ